MNITYLLLGSNMGNSLQQLQYATSLLQKQIGNIISTSTIYQTAAWGEEDQPDFLNQVLIFETASSSAEILFNVLAIENEMGRVRTKKNAPRVIDIDILFFNKEIIINNNLVVPHPEIQHRRFVLVPLNELSPNFIHPILNQTIHQLLIECKDVLNVKKF